MSGAVKMTSCYWFSWIFSWFHRRENRLNKKCREFKLPHRILCGKFGEWSHFLRIFNKCTNKLRNFWICEWERLVVWPIIIVSICLKTQRHNLQCTNFLLVDAIHQKHSIKPCCRLKIVHLSNSTGNYKWTEMKNLVAASRHCIRLLGHCCLLVHFIVTFKSF